MTAQGQLQLTDVVKGRVAHGVMMFRVKGGRLLSAGSKEVLITSDLEDSYFHYLPTGGSNQFAAHAGEAGMISGYKRPSILNIYGIDPYPPRIGESATRFFDTAENAKKWLEDEGAEIVTGDELKRAVTTTNVLCAQLVKEKMERNGLHGAIGKPYMSDKDLHASIARSLELSDQLRNDPSF